MRRTITTPSRFITFIQSWLGNVPSQWLCLLLLLIFSCKDDANFIGLPRSPRLKTEYIDIPLTPSVIDYTGVITTNPSGDAVRRILIGRYNDPVFGNIEATGYTSIAPPVIYTKPSPGATFDSLILRLNFDFYHYGDATTSQQKLQIFEVLDTLINGKTYTNSYTVPLSTNVLAETTFEINPASFDNALEVNADRDTSNNKIFSIKIKIPGSYGSNLFEDMRSPDSVLYDFKKFTGKYKGFGLVVPNGNGDKILGINPVFKDPYPVTNDTKLTVYWTETDGTTTTQVHADFVLNPSVSLTTGRINSVVSFSRILTDRNATTLSGIVPFKEFRPSDGRFYIQGGTSLITKFDLTPFYNFIDTIDYLSFNEAELIVNNINTQKPPINLSLRFLDSQNHFRTAYVDTLRQDTLRVALDPYLGKISTSVSIGQTSANRFVTVGTDLTGATFGVFPDNYAIDKIILTQFCQQIFKHKRDNRRPASLGMLVDGDLGRKSVNGIVLDPSTVLRIYYSKPVIKIQ
ncbi:hypothetical protein BH10BAC4_BH10BAC4_13730 [soil metagenome]